MAITTVDDLTVAFHPATLVVEQGDYVRWQHTGASLCHTTTSGNCASSLCSASANACTASGPWDCVLPPGARFTRQFQELPSDLPYFCRPHCTLGMKGDVKVTTRIVVTASGSAGTLTLAWSGGGGQYRVFRGNNPAFTGAGAVTLSPSSGTTLTSVSDATQPLPGAVLFYLVMNQF